MPNHEVFVGKIQLYKRPKSRFWWCSASVGGKQRRSSTEQEDYVLAQEWAEDWLLTLRGKERAGLLKSGKTFREVAATFFNEYDLITEGQRSPLWVAGHELRIRVHLNPFFGDLTIGEVTRSKVQEYRVHRAQQKRVRRGEKPENAKGPARNTIHNEIVTLRLILKTAERHGWIEYVPDLSPPYKTQGKRDHRPWFSPAEYKQLYEATRAYAQEPSQKQHKWNAEQVHDYVLFMANTGLRPDEAAPRNLLHQDVAIVFDEDSGEWILEITVRGKLGVGFCKSMPGAVRPYQRLLARALPGPSQSPRARMRRGETSDPLPSEPKYPQASDPVFPGNHIKLFNGILRRAKLKFDREGKRRTA
jgi:integrase